MISQTVFRHEKKYPLSQTDYLMIRSLVGSVLTRDPNANPQGDYFIRSVYYDTLDNTDYFNKINGIEHRKKLRARIYGFNSLKVKIELKKKHGQYMSKVTDLLNIEDYRAFHNNDYHTLPIDFSKEIGHTVLSNHYHPVITVDYTREAYVHPFSNIRINFDKNIRWSKSNFDIFDPDLDTLSTVDDFYCLMEVKYNTFLPDWITGLLNQIDTTQSSYSKYCTTRSIGG